LSASILNASAYFFRLLVIPLTPVFGSGVSNAFHASNSAESVKSSLSKTLVAIIFLRLGLYRSLLLSS